MSQINPHPPGGQASTDGDRSRLNSTHLAHGSEDNSTSSRAQRQRLPQAVPLTNATAAHGGNPTEEIKFVVSHLGSVFTEGTLYEGNSVKSRLQQFLSQTVPPAQAPSLMLCTKHCREHRCDTSTGYRGFTSGGDASLTPTQRLCGGRRAGTFLKEQNL